MALTFTAAVVAAAQDIAHGDHNSLRTDLRALAQALLGAPSGDDYDEFGFLKKVYPVGSIYINATDNTNPATLLGFGTWSAFGAGRVPVGFNGSDADFNAAEKTGGAKTHTLTTAEIPPHSHTTPVANSATVQQSSGGGAWTTKGLGADATGNTGGGGAHNNLQPYIVCYFWKRTA